MPRSTTPSAARALEERGAEVAIAARRPRGKVDLAAMLADLGRRGINELHVEAGDKLNGSLLAAGLVDEFLVYVAPRLLGSGRGLAALGAARAPRRGARLRVHATSTRIGDDLRLLLRPPPEPPRRRRDASATPPSAATSDNAAMFTGIVSGRRPHRRSPAARRRAPRSARRLTIEAPAGWLDDAAHRRQHRPRRRLHDGRRARRRRAGRFEVDVSAESLAAHRRRSTRPGEVNLEKALRADDRLGGHLVSGHVDGVGTVTRFERVGESWELRVEAPGALARFLAYKGSIAVDGVSLTVNRVDDCADGCEFSVNLIPHTLAHTTLRALGRRPRASTSRSTRSRAMSSACSPRGPAR